MRKFLFTSVLVIFFLNSFSQRYYKFSGRTDKFLFELEEFMTNSVSRAEKKSIEEYVLAFSETWNDTLLLDDKQKKTIIKYCNIMSQNRFQVDPYFTGFLNSVEQARKTANLGNELLQEWFESISWFLDGKSKSRFKQYLDFSLKMFEGNYIYHTQNVKWQIDKLLFEIEKEGRFPIYKFKSVDLKCYTRNDSSLIEATSGSYNPILSKWEGEMGKVYYTRVGFDKNKVWVELDKYDMILKSATLFVDTVTFYNYNQFSQPIKGNFIEKILANPGENPSYPQFNSFETELVIKNIFENIDFQGGYSLRGAKTLGIGNKENDAQFIFKRNSQAFIYARASSFLLEKTKIVADNVEINMVLKNDSIYHPGLSLQYLDDKKELSLYREEKGLDQTPFYNTFHRIDMYVEGLYWKLDEDFIDMKTLQQPGSRSEARFFSHDFFSQREYDRLQGLDRINPVLELYNYITQIGWNEFYVDDYARYIGFSKSVAMQTLMRLAVRGFLIYDVESNYVIVKNRVETYVKASEGKVDYDVIRFYSQTIGIPNASMDLFNYDLRLEGVNNVFLSDSQKVYIYPKKGQLTIKENRDFVFEGLIKAGRFDMFAKECYFSYDKFELDMPIIDSLSFKVKSFEKDEYGSQRLVRVKAVIEDLKGNLLLDMPNNKSGRESYPEYPILNSKSDSYVYYDKKNKYPDVYNRKNFYYKLEAFQIDSLDDFETEGLEFNGYFASAGIFPNITDPLKVQRDYSLGLKTTTPISGYPVYANKGDFFDTISLSNQGLEGSGRLKYLTSTSYSDNFVFFPDSTKAFLQKYEIEGKTSGTEYPNVVAQNVKMKWLPYSDIMTTEVSRKQFPIVMYDNEAKLNGKLDLTPSLLSGKGQIAIQDAETSSDLYKFNNRVFTSDTCDFKLKKFVDDDMGMESLASTDENAYTTSNFKAVIDFDERTGAFEANGGEQKVEFNENMYICYMDMFIWYMDEDKTEFASREGQVEGINALEIEDQVDLDLTGSEFYSVHPDQDSLNFVAQRAVYRRRAAEIHAFEVSFIRTADAAVIPENFEVKIYRKAEMEEFDNAEILINTITKYHKIHSASVNIEGRKRYNGRGIYDFIDATGNTHNIYFDKIRVDTTGQSYATGSIKKEADFTFSPKFAYYGDARLEATKKYLKYTGGVQLSHSCDTLDREWLYFSDYINPAEIFIPVSDSAKTIDNLNMYAGYFQNRLGSEVYAAFLRTNLLRTDNNIFNVGGYLTYDEVSAEYKISSKDKLTSKIGPDDFISLNERNCQIYSEGKYNIAVDPAAIEFNTYGKMTHYLKQDSTMSKVAISMDFHFNKKALELMANDINTRVGSDPVNLDNDYYMLALGQMFGQKKMEEYSSDIATNAGRYRRVPKELQKSIFFTDVEFKYNPRARAFVSEGKIGIGHIADIQVNKYVDGVIKIENKNSRTEITIALDLDGDYYIFYYDARSATSIMRVYTSNEEFNTLIKEEKSADAKIKTEDGKSYQYSLYNATAFKKFMREIEMRR